TLPGISQTIIITRPKGRTPISNRESIIELARHQATMAIFLGVAYIDRIVEELKAGGYPDTTPVAVVYKASWPEQRIIRGTLMDISEKVKEAGITSTALILVGQTLEPKNYDRSKLYDASFTHGYRRGKGKCLSGA
ncbi:MAG: SAM-dependent methyltransferase, partial [Candidatus Bathyarchaeia archaeon]